MDPQVTNAVSAAKSLLTSVQTNMTLNEGDRRSFVDMYNTRIQDELNRYENNVKNQTQTLLDIISALQNEISSNINGIPRAS